MLTTFLILSFAFWATAKLVPGFELRGPVDAVVAAALFTMLDYALGAAITALTKIGIVGIGFLTLGLGFFLLLFVKWLVTAILLKIADALTDRLTIRSFGTAVIASFVLTFVQAATTWALGR